MTKAALYVHIPFCARKCAYCDFESYAGRLDRADEYIARVLSECARARAQYGVLGVPSAYIGGGTPSLLSPEQLKRLLGGVLGAFQADSNAEISMEANPGTVTPALLRAARTAGVNRLSFGAQCADAGLLRMLGRIHLWEDVIAAVRMAREAGFDNLNLDLMYALPGQSAEVFRDGLQKALALAPAHISCYSLILEPGTPLEARVKRGELLAPGDEVSIKMQRDAAEILGGAGLSRYEISNYARSGRECVHNIAYWTRENYLGFGCAAHSLMDGVRFSNPDFSRYMAGETGVDRQILSKEEALEETLMLETRMTRGVNLRAFEARFGARETRELMERAEALAAGGFLRAEGGFLSLTPRGMDVQDAVVLKLLP